MKAWTTHQSSLSEVTLILYYHILTLAAILFIVAEASVHLKVDGIIYGEYLYNFNLGKWFRMRCLKMLF